MVMKKSLAVYTFVHSCVEGYLWDTHPPGWVKVAVTSGTNHMSEFHTDEQRFGRIKYPVLLCWDKSIYYVIKACALVFANVNYL